MEGNQLRCPGCEQLGQLGYNFSPLDRNERYRRELNVVYRHRKDRGGCGHVFSPGDIWIIEAYLAGDLVPRAMLEEAREVIDSLRDAREGITRAGEDSLSRMLTRGGET